MSTLERRQPGGLAVPTGARMLGQRTKPIIRLGMGVKKEGTRQDGSTYTRPDKTDHFTVRGDERAVAKFKTVYGDQPKAIKIMVPSELSLALDISYRAFVGGQSEDGGRPLALGMTNFAPLGYVGGPDVLRVWRQDGTFEELETQGLDELGKPLDDVAADLDIAVHTTFTFTIPEVLGWGSFAAVTSKGKKSADNLAFKLGEIYSAFGSQAPWAFSNEEPPMLVLKPDSALMRMDGKWAKTRIYVLDIVIPESFNDMRDRIAVRQREIAGAGGAQNMLYGGSREVRELEAPAPDPEPAPQADVVEASVVSEDSEPSPAQADAPPAAEPEPEPEPGPSAGITVEAASAAIVHKQGSPYDGKMIAEVAAMDGGPRWFSWALKNWAPDQFRTALEVYVKAELPEVWSKFEAWKAEQS